MSNTFAGHSSMKKHTCGYSDVKYAFENGVCPYCEEKIVEGSITNL